MAAKWKNSSYPGVRFYEHATRKHGVRKDRYFAIRYQFAGERKEEGLGWASQGWTASKAAGELAELKKNQTTGDGPISMKEKRLLEARRREEVQRKADLTQQANITFREYFEAVYLPNARETKKPESVRKECEHVKNWIGPATDSIPMKDLQPLHLERIRSNMLAGKCAVASKKIKIKARSPRSIEYVFATFRGVWNHARDRGIVAGGSPTRQVKRPKVSNQRQRYLTRDEAARLLARLAEASQQTHDICLLSLHTGMRFSEVVSLTWGCLDMVNGRIQILNAKGMKDRFAFMRPEVREMLDRLGGGRHDELIFKSRTGGQVGKVSKTFDGAVADLGLNRDVTDPKQKFTFHALRHTFASWLVESGTDLYLVQKLLGHSTPVMTQRYSHLSDELLKKAVLECEAAVQQLPAQVSITIPS